MPTFSGTSNTAQARAEEAAVAKKQGQSVPVYSNTPQPVSANNQRLQGLTDGGWTGSTNAQGQPVGELAIYQANQKKQQTGIVDSASAKTDLSKIQTDFQSILSSLQNKQQYNQMGLNATNSVVDLMKSKGIADTSQQARQQLAQQAGISDYNPANAESNKKLADAIMGSKAVGSAMSQMTPGTPAYDSALTKVSGAVSNTSATGNMQGTVTQAQAPAEPLTSMGTKVSEDPQTAQYDKVTKEIDDNNVSITESLNQLRTGAIPLTADQTAVVDATQRSFENAINQQKSANQSQENVVRQDAFRGGSEYTASVSSSIIKNVIDSNILKISEYDQKAIASVAQLKQDFKNANYKAIKEGYDALQNTLKDKQKNMLDLMKLSHDYEKASLDHKMDIMKFGLDTSRYNETVRSNKASEANTANKTDSSNIGKIVKVNGVDYMQNADGSLTKPNVPVSTVVSETSKTALKLIESILPSSDDITGFGQNPFNWTGLTNAKALNEYDQLKSLLTLENRTMLKGQGAISDFEARTLQKAATALGRNLNNEDFKTVLTDLKTELTNGDPATATQVLSPEDQSKVDLMRKENPGITDKEIEGATGIVVSFSNVGGDTKQASVENLKQRIARVETGGRANPYTTRSDNPTKRAGGRLDWAYGKYQVMGDNIASWTKEALGQTLTIAQFKNNPDAQEKVASFKFAQYLKKHGTEEDAASVWFTGQPLAVGKNRKDSNGTTGQQYVNNVMRG